MDNRLTEAQTETIVSAMTDLHTSISNTSIPSHMVAQIESNILTLVETLSVEITEEV